MGQIVALVSGVLMSLQGVFNTRVQEKSGIWFTNALVQGIGFITSLIMLFFTRDGHFNDLKHVNKLYLVGGVLGAGIVYTVIVAIGKLGPAQATMLILIAQLLASYLIELFGLFDTERVAFEWSRVIGIAVIIVGIVIFKWERT